ncbi:MAG: 50S ribosomal protein L11 methyltransferase [Proteobacteria bacterium]|nr:50S ribosomal protein L11 methyltransferase [Pseudomonadota bacterium]
MASYPALRFDVADEDAEAWADALLDAGALAVDVSDPRAGTPDETPLYGEPGIDADSARGWPVSRLSALCAVGADPDALLAAAAAALATTPPSHAIYAVPEQDWVRATQAQFGPIAIEPGVWIVPSWEKTPAGAEIAIELDPGLAFGTGSHPTTRLCVQWLRANVDPAAEVLDYGCGSGILAIAAAKFGAARVTGIDVDAQAIRASVDNAHRNGVTARFVLPDALAPHAYDVVVANILSNPLILLAPALAGRVRDGGRIALAGILDAQEDAVRAAYAPWFTLAAWRRAEGWVLLAGTRHPTRGGAGSATR